MAITNALLVEDSSTDARLLSAHCGVDGRFSLIHASTLAEARQCLRDGPLIDVIVLDLHLPDSNGLNTFSTLHKQFSEIPIVILSGHGDEDLAVQAVSQGAQDYVPKNDINAPLLMRSLLYAIERNARLVAERRNAIIERDLAVASEIQSHLMPDHPPHVPGFDIAAVCQPAEACCGDFFDFIDTGDGRLDLLVADVSSHGFGPAMIMVGARRILRTFAPLYDDLGKILSIADQAITDDTLPEQFVTLFYARLDPDKRAIEYCAAGHTAWILDADGQRKLLDCSGLPLGLVPELEYELDGVVELERGDTLMLATDGAWEAMSPAGEQFGQERILQYIRQQQDASAAETIHGLSAEIGHHCFPGAPTDDVTMVLVKVGEAQ